MASNKQLQRPDMPVNFDSIKTNKKKDEDFRVYNEKSTPPRVIQHYKDMRANQTVEFYRKMEEKYSFENGKYRKLMTIEEAFAELESYVVSHWWNSRCCQIPERMIRRILSTDHSPLCSY